MDLPDDEIGKVPPPNYDLEKLATEQGLTFQQTGEVSAFQLRDMDPIGKTFILASRRSLIQAVFADGGLFKPIASIQPLGGLDPETGGFRVNEFIVVKVADLPAREPTFDEVKDDVAAVWKKQKASELAFEEAKKLATEAQGVGTDAFRIVVG